MSKAVALLLFVVLATPILAADSSVSDFARKPSPAYPRESFITRQEGSGKYRLDFDTNGHVKSVVVVRSTGYHRLDESAKYTLSHWQLKPGKNQNSRIVPITFTAPPIYWSVETPRAVTGTNIPGYRPSRLFQGTP